MPNRNEMIKRAKELGHSTAHMMSNEDLHQLLEGDAGVPADGQIHEAEGEPVHESPLDQEAGLVSEMTGGEPRISENPPASDPGRHRVVRGAPPQPATHTVHPGDRVRKPTEEEVLTRDIASKGHRASGDESVENQLDRILKGINAVRGNRKKWGNLSTFQRYALIGIKAVCEDVLQAEPEGVPVDVGTVLGFDPKTGHTVGG